MFPYDDNPDFAALRAAHHAQHGLTIAYIKKRVGEGMEYANEVARAVLSAQGGYYQLTEMPEEFAGRAGRGRLASSGRTRGSVGNFAGSAGAGGGDARRGRSPVRSLSLYVLYAGGSLRTRQGMFVFDQRPGEAPFAHGAWQPDALRASSSCAWTAAMAAAAGARPTHAASCFSSPRKTATMAAPCSPLSLAPRPRRIWERIPRRPG